MLMQRMLTRVVSAFTALSLLLAVVPVGAQVTDWTEWQPLMMEDHVSSRKTDVARLRFPQTFDRFLRVNDLLLAVLYPDGCILNNCTDRDVALLYGGEMRIVGRDIPESSLNVEHVLRNNQRLVWALPDERNAARFDVFELDFVTGEVVQQFDNLFFDGVTHVDVFTGHASDFYFVAHNRNSLTDGRRPVAITRAFLGSSHLTKVNHVRLATGQLRKMPEEIMDIDEHGTVLTKVDFGGGRQELWRHWINDEVPEIPHYVSTPVPGSHTIDGHLLAAQYVGGGDIEFFRYQELNRFDASTNTTDVLDDFLFWQETEEAQGEFYVVGDGTLFYVAETDLGLELRGRANGETIPFGQYVDLRLDGPHVMTRVFDEDATLASTTALVFDLATGELIAYDDEAIDVVATAYGNVGLTRVPLGGLYWHGEDALEDGIYLNVDAQDAFLADDYHAYWTDATGQPFQGTIKPGAPDYAIDELVTTEVGGAVYAVMGDTHYTIPNEKVFYTWQDNFNGLRVMHESERQQWLYGGELQLRPGTLMRLPWREEVYQVLPDFQMVRIVDVRQAQQLYGFEWWHNVELVSAEMLNQYLEVSYW